MEFEGTIKCVLCHGRLPYDKNSFTEMEMHLKTQHRVIFFINVLIQYSKDLKNKEEAINANMHIKQESGVRHPKGVKKESIDIVIEDDECVVNAEIVIDDDESIQSETFIVDESSDDDISPQKVENNTNCDNLPAELRKTNPLTNERANSQISKISNMPVIHPVEFVTEMPEPQNIVINNNKHGEFSEESSTSNNQTNQMNRELGQHFFSNNESTNNAGHFSVSNSALFNKYEDQVLRAGLHQETASDPYTFNDSGNERSIIENPSDEQKVEIYTAEDGFFSVQIEVKKTAKMKNNDLVSNNRVVSSKLFEALELAKDVVPNGTDDFITPMPLVSIDCNKNKVKVNELLLRGSSANSRESQKASAAKQIDKTNSKDVVINQHPGNVSDSGARKSNEGAQNNLVTSENGEDSLKVNSVSVSMDIDESDHDNLKRRILFDSAQHKPKKKLKLALETTFEKNKKITLQDKRKYLCEQCNKLYVSKLSLKTHVCKGFQLRVCKVKSCEASFDNKYDLDLHNLAHMENQPPHQGQKISCNQQGCSETFENSSQLREHEFSAHLPPGLLDDIVIEPDKGLDEPVQPLPQAVEKKIFHCSHCGKAFSSEHGIKVHKSKMHS